MFNCWLLIAKESEMEASGGLALPNCVTHEILQLCPQG